MEQRNDPAGQIEALQEQVAYAERVKQVTDRVHAAKDLDQLFVELQDEILGLFDAERLGLYAIDYDKKEVYSKFLDLNKVKEIRVSLNEQSIVGFVARHRKMVNLADAYNAAERARINPALAFDSSWDKQSGLRTTQVLAAPMHASNNLLTGVIQLINKKTGPRFTPQDENKVRDLARTLGIAFSTQYQLASKKPTKFDALLAAQLLSHLEMEATIREAREKQQTIESVLMGKYRISRRDIGNSFSIFYQCPFFEPGEYRAAPRELLQNINLNYLKTNVWIPLRATEEVVEVLIDDPHAFHKVRDIKRLFPLKEIKFVVGLRDDILQFINAVGASLDSNAPNDAMVTILGQLEAQEPEKPEESPALAVDENDSAIVRLVNQIIIDAYKMGASDIHIEPCGEKRETLIRCRVDGNCYEYLKVPATNRRALVSRLKIMARLDIAERRKPQDGKIRFRLSEQEIELRVATIPTGGIDNEDVVMRILTSREPLPLEKLQMSEQNLREFQQLLHKPYGIILCVGPTGSGKTTTLHSSLGYINTPHRKIWTAEDPIEITQYGLRQVQVHPKIGFDFAAAMRAFLRADPDVIMVGEIRDRETAEISIQASLTGHLVFSTLHTNSAVESVTRLLEMGMDPFNFADALLGILAQRLARTVCLHCKERYQASKEEYDALAYGYGEEAFAQLSIPYNDAFVLYRGRGCGMCHQTGYKGRIGLHELLVAAEDMRSLIHARATVPELLKVAIGQGMTTLLQDGILKCLQGWTDYKQVQAVALR